VRSIPSNRELSSEECHLVEWLVAHGHPGARHLLASVPDLRVATEVFGDSFCALEFQEPFLATGPPTMLAEFMEQKANGEVTTVVLFGHAGWLHSIEAWAADADRTPSFPLPEALRAIT
jgi:hypothetical protein